MSVPVRALVRQWMLRRSSPGMYSRSAWKDMSLSEMVRVAWPSRSRSSPAPVPSRETVAGWTYSSTGSVQRMARRATPSGSARTERTGPTMTTARWAVGMA